ncbi:hypothetical protein JP0046_14090 [Helicobacter pylori]|nr:hypothetical protein JP0046_14090 [Helicobacter pylori]
MSNQLKDLFEKQKEASAGSKQEDNEEILQFIGFIIGDEEYAIPILNILEIVKPIGYTRVPETPNYVRGEYLTTVVKRSIKLEGGES